MKSERRKNFILTSIFLVVVFFSFSSVSAFSFSEFWSSITGEAVYIPPAPVAIVIQICNDTDVNTTYPDGKNYYLEGNTSGENVYGDYMSRNDSCSWNLVLTENYCQENILKTDYVYCENCSEGKCLTPVQSCVDTDKGKDYYLGGDTAGLNVYNQSQSSKSGDYCLNQTNLYETFCNSYGQSSSETYSCPSGCNFTARACNPAPVVIVTPMCNDTDINETYSTGKNIYKKGNATDSTSSESDVCWDSKTLFEMFCVGEHWDYMGVECPTGTTCQDGACVILIETTTNVTITDSPSNTNVETPTQEIPTQMELEEQVISVEELQGKICEGCQWEEKCYPLGYRTSISYCSTEGFIKQKGSKLICSDNFECVHNLCIDSKCVEKGFFARVIEWFRKLFGWN